MPISLPNGEMQSVSEVQHGLSCFQVIGLEFGGIKEAENRRRFLLKVRDVYWLYEIVIHVYCLVILKLSAVFSYKYPYSRTCFLASPAHIHTPFFW